ncbi:phosphatidylethanolamine N-methyltransferase [Chytridiales sp. JEL 0842]|nr:phosphatidylethanolamine N-methyltransferase [Chytridiales sp. JEL 0842]
MCWASFPMDKSATQYVVRLTKKYGFGPNAGKRRGPWTEFFVKEMKRKMHLSDEEYNKLPIEFTAWILFRGLVDVISVNDIMCYCLFVLSYFHYPDFGALSWSDLLRFSGGFLLLFLHFWVRVDTRRVVKDFAWYWGDFFFLIDTSSSLSGAFEIAPHPLYSVGYVGFYGAALIAKSYTVLFVSLAAHAAQLGFLFFVETPHIEKTYNNPTTSKTEDKVHDKHILQSFFQRDLVIFRNFDWFRSTDFMTAAIWTYGIINAYMLGPIENNSLKLYFYIGQAMFWRLCHNGGLGLILVLQSKHKFWSRHFIKYGETPRDAFNHWKSIFNLTQSMTHLTFFICAYRLYTPPPFENWYYGTVMLKHTIALLLTVFHMWTATSIHKSLGDFGWFYGDFFIESLRDSRALTYTGIYRFLNHPNAWASTASAWGITWMCSSWPLVWVTLFSHICTWLFVYYVEGPHMSKLYGSSVRPRKEAGMEKALRKGVKRVAKRVKRIGDAGIRKVMSSNALGSLLRNELEENGVNDLENSDDEGIFAVGSYTSANVSDDDDHDDSDHDGSANHSAETHNYNLRRRIPRERKNSEDSGDSRQIAMRRSPSLTDRMSNVVDKAAPKVKKMVEKAQMLVKSRVEKIATAALPSRSELFPHHLYSITFPQLRSADLVSASPLSFKLGEPITIEFNCAREFLKRKDWIGIFSVTSNLSREVTVSKTATWLYLSGSQQALDDDDATPLMKKLPTTSPTSTTGKPVTYNIHEPKKYMMGQTLVTVRRSEEDQGLRVVTGQLTFRRTKLPWKIGSYEVRYHLDNAFSVLAISQPFEICVEPFQWAAYSGKEETLKLIELTLVEYVQRCLDFGSDAKRLDSAEDILSRCEADDEITDTAAFTKYKEDVAKNIVYGIHQIFDVEFSWKAVNVLRTVHMLSQRIYEARQLLAPLQML